MITAGLQLDYINSQRSEMKLITNEPLENAPPSLAFLTVALGAFRGLIVDVLWLRVDSLKQEGQFFDAKQLAEWISALQPRFAEVWEFHAWNMAYNISVAIPATRPEQRWRWVKNGYELLRDKGIPLNPKAMLLYRELARIFQHKIGGVTDKAHKYYKLQLAESMTPLLGPADNAFFKSLAEAPMTWEEMIQDPNIVPIIEALQSADDAFEDEEAFVPNYLSLRQTPARYKPQAFEVIDIYRNTSALKNLDIFAKAWQLRHQWKMDPKLMHELNQKFGPIDWEDPNVHMPLDWRLADAHAIYWAAKGLQRASQQEYSVAEAHTDRIINHSLQNLYRAGKMFIWETKVQGREIPNTTDFELKDKNLFLRPDFRMFKPYNDHMVKVIEKYKELRRGTYNSMRISHRNMLSNAVLSFYQTGHKNYARKIYNEMQRRYSDHDQVNYPFDVFIKRRLIKEIDSLGFTDSREMVVNLLREAFFRYALRDDEESYGLEKMAQEVYNEYRNRYQDRNRIDLPEMAVLKYAALQDFYFDQQYPKSLRNQLMSRIDIERPELAEKLREIEEERLKKLEEQQQ